MCGNTRFAGGGSAGDDVLCLLYGDTDTEVLLVVRYELCDLLSLAPHVSERFDRSSTRPPSRNGP